MKAILPPPRPATESEPVALRDPFVAAILAWLIPGLGHWYQGRRAKAVIFFICILSSFYYGLYLGGGRVVYASWNVNDRRLPLLCQAFVGLPTLPAFVQSRRLGYYNDEWNLRSRTILALRARLSTPIQENEVPAENSPEFTKYLDRLALNEGSFWSWFMVPPVVKTAEGGDVPDELDLLHKYLNRYFELGTVYTMIAGLLNILAIYDAWGGPAFSVRSPKFQSSDDDLSQPPTSN